MKPCDLSGKSALVTGSARGIGHAIADGLRSAGAQVIFHGLHPRPDDIPADAPFLQADLGTPANAAQLCADAVSLLPNLDTLVCNAGSFFDVPFLEMDLERWQRTFDLNLTSPYFLVQAFARHLIAAQRSGSVVLITSTNGFQAEEDSTAYDTSKGALVMLTRTLAQALAPHGIRVNAVAPGLIRTPLTQGWIDAGDGKKEHYEDKILLSRIGEPQDCAGAVAFLASPSAGYITGQILTVDGGLTVGQIGRFRA